MSAPLTVTLPCPRPPMFPDVSPDTIPPSKLTASLAVPTPDPIVTTALRLAPTPDPALHITKLSDAHFVPSHPVSPIPAPALYDPAPRLVPLTVTLPRPVDA
eukprot:2536801-Rhodomonas_salina.1